jgi:NAD(P)H-hydrate repair Nnr-like enzyme with NAD(P)H-hydrate epimerase domain
MKFISILFMLVACFSFLFGQSSPHENVMENAGKSLGKSIEKATANLRNGLIAATTIAGGAVFAKEVLRGNHQERQARTQQQHLHQRAVTQRRNEMKQALTKHNHEMMIVAAVTGVALMVSMGYPLSSLVYKKIRSGWNILQVFKNLRISGWNNSTSV